VGTTTKGGSMSLFFYALERRETRAARCYEPTASLCL
jgi:hypothetical protein